MLFQLCVIYDARERMEGSHSRIRRVAAIHRLCRVFSKTQKVPVTINASSQEPSEFLVVKIFTVLL